MLGFHSVSVLSVALACYALTTVEQKPLRLGSDDTGCILHFTSEWHAIDEPKEVVNPQFLVGNIFVWAKALRFGSKTATYGVSIGKHPFCERQKHRRSPSLVSILFQTIFWN